MLQHPWPCHGAFLCHMSHQKNGNLQSLCQLQKTPRHLSDLGYASRRGADLLLIHRLDRVDDHHRRRIFPYRLLHLIHVRFAKQRQGIGKTAEPLRPKPDLLQRFLPGYVKHLLFILRQMPAYLQKQRGFPDARISAHQHKGALHNAAPQHPVHLFHTGGEPLLTAACDLPQLHRFIFTGNMGKRGSRASHSRCRRSSHLLLHKSIPLFTAGTLPQPLAGLITAFLTKEHGRLLPFRHIATFISTSASARVYEVNPAMRTLTVILP